MSGRRIPGDWHDGTVPDNVLLHPESHIDSSYSFIRFRSRMQPALTLSRGAAVYKNTRFDLGINGQVEIGAFVMINGAEVICDGSIRIGAYSLISWNVVLMDSYRAPYDAARRRVHLRALAEATEPLPDPEVATKPIEIGENVWIGHDVVVLPGVSIGTGSVIGARSAVFEALPDYCIAAGNPARVIRWLDKPSNPKR
jgi:acetyltransferase-like isoleucine patch superfamily enzyme